MRDFESGARLFSKTYRQALRKHRQAVGALSAVEDHRVHHQDLSRLQSNVRIAVGNLDQAVKSALDQMTGDMRTDRGCRHEDEILMYFSRTTGILCVCAVDLDKPHTPNLNALVLHYVTWLCNLAESVACLRPGGTFYNLNDAGNAPK